MYQRGNQNLYIDIDYSIVHAHHDRKHIYIDRKK